MDIVSRRDFLTRALKAGGVLAASALLDACTIPTPAGIATEPPTAVSATAPPPTPTAPPPTPTPGPSATPTEPPPPTPPILPEDQMVLKGVVEVSKVAKELGEDAINNTPDEYGLNGADLGSMLDKDGKLYMVFGDSFGCCIPGTGGPGNAMDWRPNTMAIISDRDRSDGLTFDDMITDRPGHAGKLLSPSAFDRTVIPTYGVALGDRMFLHTMAVLAWGDPGEWLLNESGLAYSDDDGKTWTKDDSARWDGQSNFGQVAIVESEGDVYFFGIPGGRFGGVKLARVSQDAILDISSYRYLTGISAGAPEWDVDEGAAVLIVPPPVGELSVMWNPYLDRWIMTYLDESRASLVIREAVEVWGPWSVALPLASGAAYPGLYGAYMHPWLVENGGEVFYFTMSQWGPYSVFLMRVRLIRR